jgi:hypothetical protein
MELPPLSEAAVAPPPTPEEVAALAAALHGLLTGDVQPHFDDDTWVVTRERCLDPTVLFAAMDFVEALWIARAPAAERARTWSALYAGRDLVVVAASRSQWRGPPRHGTRGLRRHR